MVLSVITRLVCVASRFTNFPVPKVLAPVPNHFLPATFSFISINVSDTPHLSIEASVYAPTAIETLLFQTSHLSSWYCCEAEVQVYKSR